MSEATKNRIESIKRLIKHADAMLMLLQEAKASINNKNVSASLEGKINHINQIDNVLYDVA